MHINTLKMPNVKLHTDACLLKCTLHLAMQIKFSPHGLHVHPLTKNLIKMTGKLSIDAALSLESEKKGSIP